MRFSRKDILSLDYMKGEKMVANLLEVGFFVFILLRKEV